MPEHRQHLGLLAICFLGIVLSLSFTIRRAFGNENQWEAAYRADVANEEAVNSLIQSSGGGWVAKSNPISVLPREEARMRLGLKMDPNAEVISQEELKTSSELLPSGFDWRNNGGNYVTPVTDQGACGGCWAFASTAAIESKVLISFNTPGTNTDLSEQIVISCTHPGVDSCDGGYLEDAASFLQTEGVAPESCYPYTQTNGTCGSTCSNWQSNGYRINNWTKVVWGTTATTDQIKNALYSYGPLVVTMYVYSDFYYYLSGVYKHTGGTYEGAHAVLVVGWDDTAKAFIVKNSWGSSWGESGYFRIGYSELTSSVKFGFETAAYGDAVASKGPAATRKMLLSNSGGYACIWTLSTSGTLMSYMTYGPYSGWTPVSYARNFSDNSARMLWVTSSGQACIWWLDSSDNFVGFTVYGPYAGWTPVSYARGADGQGLLLWKNTLGMGCLFGLDSSDNYLNYATLGPYSGFSPVAVHRNLNGTYRLVWQYSNGMEFLWSLDSSGNFAGYQAFGPVSGWTAKSYNQSSDGTPYLIWGQAGTGVGVIMVLDANDNYSGFATEGPFSGWTLASYE